MIAIPLVLECSYERCCGSAKVLLDLENSLHSSSIVRMGWTSGDSRNWLSLTLPIRKVPDDLKLGRVMLPGDWRLEEGRMFCSSNCWRKGMDPSE
jgi:hypothetical protein